MSVNYNCDASGVGEIVLDRPDHLNALGLEAFETLMDALDSARRDRVRALVMRAEGTSFCVGRDLKGIGPDEDVQASLEMINRALLGWHTFPAPTFAAVQGHCLGAGVGLALFADVTFVDETTRIASPFGALGAIPDCGFHVLLTQRMGEAVTKYLILSGRPIDGPEAFSRGLVGRCVPQDQLLSSVRSLAQEVASGPTRAFAQSMDLVDDVLAGADVARSLDHEARGQAVAMASADFRAGLHAFLAKERAVFTGA